MEDEELIDSYIHRPSISDDTKFLTGELKSVLDLLEKINSTKVNLNTAKGVNGVASAAKSAKEAAVSLEAAKANLLEAKAKKELANATLLEAKARKENAAASVLEAKAKKESAQATKTEAQARKENANAALQEQKASDSASNTKAKEKAVINEIGRAYIEYSKAAREASLRAKSYALTLGETSPVTLAAVKNAKEMNDILLRVDQSVGQSGRNVGNYKSAFDGLGMSFTQVARELPSLAISSQQFILAISNNLPMVQDEIRKARLEIAALKAEGKETPSLLRRIGGSIISWNVGLSVGIALLTAYGGKIIEWVTSLVSSEAAQKKATKQQQEYNERVSEGIELNDRYYTSISRRAGVINRDLENQIAYARAAGKSEKEILELEKKLLEQRQLLAQTDFNASGGARELDTLGNKADIARQNLQEFLKISGELSEEDKARGEFLKKDFELAQKAYDRQKGIVEEYYNANRDAELKDIELKKLAAEQRSKFFAEELQYRADILKNFSEIEEAEEITRINARKQALKNERAIIAGQYSDEIREAKGNQAKIYEVNREYTFKRKKLQEDYERDLLAIHQTGIKQRREAEQKDHEQFIDDQEEALNKQIENIQKEQERRIAEEAKGQAAEISALNKWYERKLAATKEGSKRRQKIEEEYAERRAAIEYSYAVASVKNEIWAAEQILKVRKAAGIDVTKQEEDLAKYKKQLSDLETQHFVDNEKRKSKVSKERMAETERDLQEVLRVSQAVSGLIGGLISANVDRDKNVIQDQIDDIDKKKEKEIEAINASAATQQEKAEQIAILNARSAAQKEALERKQRQLDLQRARFEKAANLTRIAVETALAVVHQLASGDPYTAIPRAIAAGALGTAQFIVAAAAPLPKFKHGREDGPATFGVVGDGGKKEVIYSPDLKHAMVTPGTDTLAFIPKGYGVSPSVEEFQAMAMKMAHKDIPVMPVIQNNNNNNDGLIRAMAYEIGSLKRAIIGKQETHFHWSNGELHKSIKNGNSWDRYIQDNI
jgi:hypothetical protein